jgi:hypothetical protein
MKPTETDQPPASSNEKFEEMLLIILARMVMLEAKFHALAIHSLTDIAFRDRHIPSLNSVADVFLECQRAMAQSNLEYLCQQFPEEKKMLLDHASLPAVDIRASMRKALHKLLPEI